MQAMAVYNFTYVILLRMLGYLKDLFDSLHVAADFTGAIYICVLDLIPVRFALTSAQMPSRAKIEERIGVRLVAMEELALLAWYHLSNSFRFIKLAYAGFVLSSIVPLRFPQFPSEPLLETPTR